MKRFISSVRLISALVLIGFAVTTAPSQAEGEVALILKGRILHAEGSVSVRMPGEADWKPIQDGAWIDQGAEIKTGQDGKCEIGLGGDRKSLVRMKPDTETHLSAMTADNIQVDLKAGRVFTLVRDLNPGSTFQVVSPTAVATARGTGWEQDVDTVQVFEHTVEVKGSQGEVLMVEEGFGVDIEGGDIKEPFSIAESDRAEWQEFEKDAEKVIAEESKSETKDEVKDEPKGELTEQPKEEPKEDLKEEPKEDLKDDLQFEPIGDAKEQPMDGDSLMKEPEMDAFDKFDNSFGDGTGSFEDPNSDKPSGDSSASEAFNDIKDEQHDTTQTFKDQFDKPCVKDTAGNCI